MLSSKQIRLNSIYIINQNLKCSVQDNTWLKYIQGNKNLKC